VCCLQSAGALAAPAHCLCAGHRACPTQRHCMPRSLNLHVVFGQAGYSVSREQGEAVRCIMPIANSQQQTRTLQGVETRLQLSL
jgi:hypothetical protein